MHAIANVKSMRLAFEQAQYIKRVARPAPCCINPNGRLPPSNMAACKFVLAEIESTVAPGLQNSCTKVWEAICCRCSQFLLRATLHGISICHDVVDVRFIPRHSLSFAFLALNSVTEFMWLSDCLKAP